MLHVQAGALEIRVNPLHDKHHDILELAVVHLTHHLLGDLVCIRVLDQRFNDLVRAILAILPIADITGIFEVGGLARCDTHSPSD